MKKKLLLKINKEEEEDLNQLDEEYEALLMQEVLKLRQRQKQEKLIKLTQITD